MFLINIILALILKPFFGPKMDSMAGWMYAIVYFGFCGYLTPLLGIPLYKFIIDN
jgi:hypothetical protein